MIPVTRQMMEEHLFPKVEKKSSAAEQLQLTFPAFYELWYAEHQGILRASYTRKFRSVANLLDSFRPGTIIGQISEEFVRDYRRFLLKKGSSDATIAQEYKFLYIAAERAGIPPTMPWLRYAEQSAPQLDLYKEELQRLLRTPMPTAALALERDRWLLQCFAGQRDADMAGLSARQLEHLETAEGLIPCLRHARKKNTQLAMAPLPPVAVRIGGKWNWLLPKGYNQTRNKLIKQVAQVAGLTRVFNLMKISGSVATDNYRPVHEIISTLTSPYLRVAAARRHRWG